jgi:hypothetical protein
MNKNTVEILAENGFDTSKKGFYYLVKAIDLCSDGIYKPYSLTELANKIAYDFATSQRNVFACIYAVIKTSTGKYQDYTAKKLITTLVLLS